MHEKRNFSMILLLVGAVIWGAIAWLMLDPEENWSFAQRTTSLLMVIVLSIWLTYALKFEDKLPDHLIKLVGPSYYEADGLSFLPMIRSNPQTNRAELCVYYQNRFENPVEAIIHLRPPAESFIIRQGARDVHFAFKANGGDFGVIHQPIAVPKHLQGLTINVQMAAASWYPRSQGARLRRHAGIPCGTLEVDWVGNPLKIGVHVHLAMPEEASQEPVRAGIWRQEHLADGNVAMA
jgi:hypothetical protein